MRLRLHAGERTRDWLKVKCWRTHRFVVGGIERDDEGRLAALLAGAPAGPTLRYEGRVEFGLHRVAEAWRGEAPVGRSPFGDAMSDRGRTWLEPRTVIELRALPRPAGGSLRHATALRVLWRD